MQIQIVHSFAHYSSPRPFLPNELLEIEDQLARQWIAEGKAVQFKAQADAEAKAEADAQQQAKLPDAFKLATGIFDPAPTAPRRRRLERALKPE